VRDTSITDLIIQARTGARVLGKIELSPELATLNLSQVAITARPLDGWDLEGFPVGRVADDGTFASAALPAGKYMVLPNSPGAWFAESAVFQGMDVLGTGIEIGNSDAAGLMVTISSRKAQVTGKVTDSAGRVRPDAHVVFFRKGSRWLTSGLNMSPDIGNIRTNRFGEYVVQLSAGEYFVTAITGDIPDAWRDLGFLQSLTPKATAIAVARGATRIENLQVQVLRK
jgi:hypothetical protein